MSGSPRTGRSSRTEASLLGSIVAGGVVLPIVAGSVALVCARAAAVADCRVRRVRARRSRRRLPSDDAGRSLAPAARRPAREPAGQRQLSVRSHGRGDRGLRRARAAAHIEGHEHASLVRRMDGVVAAGRVRRDLAHVSRNAPSARRCRRRHRRRRARSSSSCSRAGRPAPPQRAARRAAESRSEGRGDRAFRQDTRRRPARAAPRARGRKASTDPFWCEVPKSRKAPAQVRRAVDEGAELVFAWGGDGMVQRCVDVLAGSERRARDRPGRDGEPVRRQPRDPAGHRRGRRDRPPRRARASSTSAVSTASGSQSWPGPASTRR